MRDSRIGLTKKHLEAHLQLNHNRLQRKTNMLAGCPVDRNVLYCLFQYQPELLLLFVLVLACVASLWKFLGGTRYC